MNFDKILAQKWEIGKSIWFKCQLSSSFALEQTIHMNKGVHCGVVTVKIILIKFCIFRLLFFSKEFLNELH